MNIDTLARVHAEEARRTVTSARIPAIDEITRRGTRRRWSLALAGALLAGMAAVAVVVVGSLGTDTVATSVPPVGDTIEDPGGDATFREWSIQNGRVDREGRAEVILNAEADQPEFVGVRLTLYPTLQSNGAYAYQVRIDGTGDICGFLEGTFEIDGNVGRFLNDVFPAPDDMNVGASRPFFPYICEPDPQPGTIDAVLVAPFDIVLEPGALSMSNSAGTVRFVASSDADAGDQRLAIPGLDAADELLLLQVTPEPGSGSFVWERAYRVGQLPLVNVGHPTAEFLADAHRPGDDPSQLVCLGSGGSAGCAMDDPERPALSGLTFDGPSVRAWAWAFVPDEAAAVRFVDADGGISWQRPADGIVIFPANGPCDCRMEAVDAAGAIIAQVEVDL